MTLWRISAFTDLSGRGGLLAGGRWHHAGRSVVYLAETPPGAMLEVLVHLEVDPEDLPDNLRLIRVDIPDRIRPVKVAGLPSGWAEQLEKTRSVGDVWLESGRSLLLSVPSAIMPHTNNVLFNPGHPDASKVRVKVETLRLDQRLFKPTI